MFFLFNYVRIIKFKIQTKSRDILFDSIVKQLPFVLFMHVSYWHWQYDRTINKRLKSHHILENCFLWNHLIIIIIMYGLGILNYFISHNMFHLDCDLRCCTKCDCLIIEWWFKKNK